MARLPRLLNSSVEDRRAGLPVNRSRTAAREDFSVVPDCLRPWQRGFSLAPEALWDIPKTMEVSYEQAAQ